MAIGEAAQVSGAPASITEQLSSLLRSGNYPAAFALANRTNTMGLLTNPNSLAKLIPGGIRTQAQYDAMLQAFAPYEGRLTGKANPSGPEDTWSKDNDVLGRAANQFATDQQFGFRGGPALGTAGNPTSLQQRLGVNSELGDVRGVTATPSGGYAMDVPNLQAAFAQNNGPSTFQTLEPGLLALAAIGGLAASGLGTAAAATAPGGATGAIGGASAAGEVPASIAGFDSAGEAAAGAQAATAGVGDAIGSGVAPSIGAAGGATGGATGAGSVINGAEIGAAKGGVVSALTGKNPLEGAALGAVTGGVGGEVAGATGSSLLGGAASAATGAAAGAVLTPGVSSGGGATMPIGQPTGASGLTNPAAITGDLSTPTSAAVPGTGSALPDLGSAAGGLLGGLGGMAPYLAVGGIGTALASQENSEQNSLANQEIALGKPATTAGNQQLAAYQSGTLPPGAQQVLTTSAQQGQALINAAQPMNQIAQTAFGNYQNGTLTAADALSVNNFVQSAQQQWLAANGGNADSGAKAAAFASIDAQAIQLKQQLLTQQLGVGNQEEAAWLAQTQAGQQTIQQGQVFAANALQQEFNNGLSALGLGLQPAMAGINQLMQNDQAFAQQVTQLFSGLATAYALSTVKGGTGSAGGALGSAIGKLFGSNTSPGGGAGTGDYGSNTPSSATTDPGSVAPSVSDSSIQSSIDAANASDVAGLDSSLTALGY